MALIQAIPIRPRDTLAAGIGGYGSGNVTTPGVRGAQAGQPAPRPTRGNARCPTLEPSATSAGLLSSACSRRASAAAYTQTTRCGQLLLSSCWPGLSLCPCLSICCEQEGN